MSSVKLLMQLIPDDIQDLIISIGVSISSDKWRLGDLTNEIKDIVREHREDVFMPAVYKFISVLTSEQVSARAVEYYASLSGFYDRDIRDQYSVLSHSHFAKARTYESQWRDCLEFAMSYIDEFGRAPSVAWLDANYHSGDMQIIEQASDSDDNIPYETSKVKYLLHSITTNFQELVGLLQVTQQHGALLDKINDVLDEIKTLELASIDKY